MDITKKTILVKLQPSQQELLVKNAIKHTGDTTVQAFEKLFAKSKVDLSGFTKLERDHIKSGTVAKGMRKKAVIVAFGYPPSTETAGIEADKWVYWAHRFNKLHVKFKGDKVSEVVD
jgi:hypothetical protein